MYFAIQSVLYVNVQYPEVVLYCTRFSSCTLVYKLIESAAMPLGIHAAIIADVIASSERADLRGVLARQLSAATRKQLRHKWISLPYSITAGDEFQTVTGQLLQLPELLLQLRLMLQPLSLRIGIGIGAVPGRLQPPVNRLSGEAFRMARKAIEGIKSGSIARYELMTAFESNHPGFNQIVNLIYGLHDTLLASIRPKQWESIEQVQAAGTLEQAARRMKLDISTISRNLKRGHYWQLLDTIRVTRGLIERTFR
jgi:SatD family (SatD)